MNIPIDRLFFLVYNNCKEFTVRRGIPDDCYDINVNAVFAYKEVF